MKAEIIYDLILLYNKPNFQFSRVTYLLITINNKKTDT